MSESSNPELTNPDVVNWLWRMGVPLEHKWGHDSGWTKTRDTFPGHPLAFHHHSLGKCRFRIAQKK